MTAAVKLKPYRFADIKRHDSVLIYVGSEAWGAAADFRTAYELGNDVVTNAITGDSLADIDGELMPLAVTDSQLKAILAGERRPDLANKDTAFINIEKKGDPDPGDLFRLMAYIKQQTAEGAEFWLDGVRMDDEIIDAYADKPAIERARAVTRFPLVAGYSGFDNQASYLIKGILPASGTTAIYGPSGSFKSFLAVSWACHIATGKEWDGRRVTRGAVLYVVGEGGVGVPRRLRAWADQYTGSADIPNVYRIDMPVFMAVPEQVAELKIAAEQVKRETGSPVRLIVVDTVARCFGGGDENRAADMGAFIAGCDEVKAATGATILLVHHTGKQEDNGARGSSAFRAALDAEYLVKREAKDSNSVILRNTKMKDDEPPSERAYDLRSRVVTFDSEGDEVTSLVVVDAGREPEEPEFSGLNPTARALYQAIKQAVGGNGRASKGAIREAFKVMVIDGNKPNMTNFSRYLKTLENEGLIEVLADEVRLIPVDCEFDE